MLSLWQNGPILAIMRTMRRALNPLALSIFAAGLASLASAQDGTTTDQEPTVKVDNYLGVSIGTYLPFDGDVRDAFGDAPISYGIALAQPYRTARRGLRFDVTSLGLNSNGNNFFLLGGTVGYEVQGLKQGDRPTAFARAGIGPAFYHYDVDRAGNGNDARGDKISFIGTAEVGYTFANRFILSGRYLATPSMDGLNFSGLQFSLTYAAFKL